jgi:hypothetical protein
MANKTPLVLDTTTLQLAELPTGDNLDLTGSSISSVADITLTGQIKGPSTLVIDPAVVGDDTGTVEIKGNLTVQGATTTINSSTYTVDDPLIVLADGQTTSSGVNTGGFTLGTTGISIQYNHGGTRFDCTEDFNVASGKIYEINGTSVLSSTTLGSTVVNSSLTSLGTLTALTVDGLSSIKSVTESLEVRAASQTGAQTYNYSTAAIFWHPSVAGDITPTISNVPTTASKTHSAVIVFNQGGTPYKIGTTLTVNSTSVTIKWADGTQPTGTANRVEAWNFTLINTSSTATPSWTVIGSKTSFV